ncbi:energy transducer TonB [Marinimicrobium sp. ABcell2]|uniref:energy transducer TonB n=1 Tax=Marinimicrobium sp. ABcell2 TaxID=3069751 RepID=UPI0027AF3ED4|nr:energy transducer TonB [Marinimicrobium sp. ABcell2]MDQ2076579.1 TonB family protein [Marinimicrobium sp. ABcell2]
MSSTSTPSQSPAAPVDTGDRLSFTLFLALALHAMVVFGVTFKLPDPGAASPTLDIVLASHKDPNEPDEADYLAQHNQQASGTEEEARKLTAEQHAEFADTQVRDINPAPQIQAAAPTERREEQILTTRGSSHRSVQRLEDPDPQDEQDKREGLLEELPIITQEIASLQAQLARQRQEYSRRPRIHRLTSMATRASADAAYLHEWSTRVEQTGNRHYPQEALRQRITGSLRLSVSVNPDGTVHQVEILQSSGQSILDQAAVQIVHMAAPYATFPAEIRQQYDRLEIIRTWTFDIAGLSTAQ